MSLTDQITQLLSNRRQKWDFTLESGHGETYHSGKPTLYGHSEYESSSVLAGRPLRRYLHQWDSVEAARAELAAIRKAVKRFKFDDMVEEGGSTHIPVANMVSHLPDDTDY